MKKLFQLINRQLFRSVYLCGGINGLSDSACTDWREAAKKTLKAKCIDPMRRDYRGVEDQSYRAIVHGDVRDVLHSGIVLVNATRASWGTAMEVVIAWLMGKEVVAWVGQAAISPWLKYFSGCICAEFRDAINYINRRLA